MTAGLRVVATGGGGFIGHHLVRHLLERPETGRITVVDDYSTGTPDNLAVLGGDVDVNEGSILNTSLMNRVVAGADVVVHLAAVPSVPRSLADPARSHAVNATGTLNVLEAARRAGGPLVIAASSSSVYGRHPQLPQREDALPAPASPYAVTKLAGEGYLAAYARCFSLPVLPLRFFNVYGPGQLPGHAYAAVIPAMIDAALNGREFTWHGDGTQTRDFTYVATVCDVLADAAVRRVAHDGPVNMAFGTRTSLTDLNNLLGDITGIPVPVRSGTPRPGDVADSQADPALLRSLFPQVEPLGLREGLEAAVAWHRTRPRPAL
ncbi:NAD-dependent epimerase/dehydratase family protein [Streptomyces sp. NPDC001553]|uniref:NAD-dependent epimerase/dehydratase family protein n=1 Tax=Streptomyces sp. NPDC001553 TaxID=3154385 RepID=UPI00332FBD0A